MRKDCFFFIKRIEFIIRTIARQTGGVILTSESLTSTKEKAMDLLKKDALKILHLIQVQMENLTMPQCPLYEDVLDTQMFGLSKEINFAIRLELIDPLEGKQLIHELERQLSNLHDATIGK